MEAHDYLNFHAQTNVKLLYKQFLELLEDIKEQHDINFSKLFDSLPEKDKTLIVQANYLDERAFDYFRKKILDSGNDCCRNIQSELAKFDINFKK
jgi:hypothetical protein